MINTVLGKISPSDMGITLIHEHMCFCSSYMADIFGDAWVNKKQLAEKASSQLRMIRENYGLKTIVDATPVNYGRDIALLQEISEKSGVNIIASTGMFFSEEPHLRRKRAETLLIPFLKECREGISGTGVYPGYIKIATDNSGVSTVNEMLLEMVSRLQKETNLPLFAHTCAAIKSGIKQLEIIKNSGANLDKVIIGHCGDTDDLEYVEGLLKEGCNIGYDRGPILLERANDLKELIDRGWIDKIFLSIDHCMYLDFGNITWEKELEKFTNDDKYGYKFFFETAIPAFKVAGITEKQINHLLVENPKRLLDI